MLNDEKIAELKKLAGGRKVALFTHPSGAEVVLKAPGAGEYQKWQDRRMDPETRSKAGRQLFFDCVLYPSGEDLSALVDEYPALPDSFGDDLLEMAGAAAKVEKKLL